MQDEDGKETPADRFRALSAARQENVGATPELTDEVLRLERLAQSEQTAEQPPQESGDQEPATEA